MTSSFIETGALIESEETREELIESKVFNTCLVFIIVLLFWGSVATYRRRDRESSSIFLFLYHCDGQQVATEQQERGRFPSRLSLGLRSSSATIYHDHDLPTDTRRNNLLAVTPDNKLDTARATTTVPTPEISQLLSQHCNCPLRGQATSRLHAYDASHSLISHPYPHIHIHCKQSAVITTALFHTRRTLISSVFSLTKYLFASLPCDRSDDEYD